MDPVTIEFTDAQTGEYLGRVTFEDNVLSGDNDYARHKVEAWNSSGIRTGQEFVDRYFQWGNGFTSSAVVS